MLKGSNGNAGQHANQQGDCSIKVGNCEKETNGSVRIEKYMIKYKECLMWDH